MHFREGGYRRSCETLSVCLSDCPSPRRLTTSREEGGRGGRGEDGKGNGGGETRGGGEGAFFLSPPLLTFRSDPFRASGSVLAAVCLPKSQVFSGHLCLTLYRGKGGRRREKRREQALLLREKDCLLLFRRASKGTSEREREREKREKRESSCAVPRAKTGGGSSSPSLPPSPSLRPSLGLASLKPKGRSESVLPQGQPNLPSIGIGFVKKL